MNLINEIVALPIDVRRELFQRLEEIYTADTDYQNAIINSDTITYLIEDEEVMEFISDNEKILKYIRSLKDEHYTKEKITIVPDKISKDSNFPVSFKWNSEEGQVMWCYDTSYAFYNLKHSYGMTKVVKTKWNVFVGDVNEIKDSIVDGRYEDKLNPKLECEMTPYYAGLIAGFIYSEMNSNPY